MYNLNLDRRKRDRRYLQTESTQARPSLDRRNLERRRDNRPLNEFPYLPQSIS